MSMSKTRSLILPLLLLTIGSGVACSEGADPGPGTGGGPAAGGAVTTGGSTAAGGATSGGATASGGAASGGAASGGASTGGGASGGASTGGGATTGGADGVGGASESGGGPGTGGGDSGTGGGGPTVAFSEVSDIMLMRCATCHTAPGSATKPNFSTAEAIDTALSSTMAINQCSNNPLVTVNEPEQSALVMLINGACQPSPMQMPPTGKIPAGEIQTITDWVASGAPGPE